jgi:protein-S-isoprenylcysteine O-methyltransferase Ste14
MLFTLVRALAYATMFVGFLGVFLPARILQLAGFTVPATVQAPQIAGMAIGAAGAAFGLWCILAFVFIGKGTQMPLDPPRHLVVRGPYKFVRNPMYVGAGLALVGAALYFGSIELVMYGAVLGVITHVFVVFYEERVLAQKFGPEYDAYRRDVGRWVPRL